MKRINHFADLEKEVREYLSDADLRTQVLEELAQNILIKMVEMHSYSNGPGYVSPAPKSSVSFTGAIVKGVASVIAEELGRHGSVDLIEERPAPKKGDG